MIITIFGCRPYDFEDPETKRKVSGMSLFYSANPVTRGDLKGQLTGKLSIPSNSPVYHDLFNHDYSKPIKAEAFFDLNPSTGKAILADFRVCGVGADVYVDDDVFAPNVQA